jgi:hypothetical protein
MPQELLFELNGARVTPHIATFGGTASIKPSGMLLLLLPVFARVGRDWREPLWVIIGAAGIGILVFGPLAAWGGLEPFLATMQGMMPQGQGHQQEEWSCRHGHDHGPRALC